MSQPSLLFNSYTTFAYLLEKKVNLFLSLPTMASASKSESGDGISSSKSLRRQSRSNEKHNSMDSPSSKSYTSSRAGGGGKRRQRSSPTTRSSLHETLSSFGDDVIRMKKYPDLHTYDNHGYFQSDISFDANVKGAKDDHQSVPIDKENVENELAVIMSHHDDPCFQTKHFEKVKPSEVGMKPSKWQQLFQASVSSNRFQRLKRQSKREKYNGEKWSEENNFLEEFYNSKGKIQCEPPFWGVSSRTRRKISFLSLSLILHELACFTSCVLFGCLIFQGMEAISWVQQKPLTENWLLFKWCSSLQTTLVVITCIGFLNRVDTTDVRGLWLLPFFLLPVIGLSVSDYCNKAWELQRLECFNYFRLGKGEKKPVVRQDCSFFNAIMESISKSQNDPSSNPLTELDSRGTWPLVMRIVAILCIMIISLYLFCCRKSYFLIEMFSPPQEFGGTLELALFNEKGRKSEKEGLSTGHQKEDEVRVIFKRDDVRH